MNEIPATIEIRSNNDTEVSYNTNENPDLDSTLNVTDHDSLSASINLRSTDALESTIEIVASGYDELSASLTPAPLGEAPLPATLDVAAVQENTTEIHYNSVEPPDLECTMSVIHSSMIPASIDIPVTFTEVVEANKDTFINEDKPTSRYGDYSTLSVGENYKTLIGFDFELTDASIISSAKLILSEVSDKDQEIIVKRLLSNWREADTTWANAPDESFIDYGVFNGEEVDITELVKKWHSGELENNGILLEGLNEVVQNYYSREYTNYNERPKLEIRYYDPNILAYNGAENLVSSVDIPYTSDLQSSIEIDPLNDPDLESQLEVKYPGDSELNSSVGIKVDDQDEIIGTTTINKPNLPGELYVLERDDITGTVTISNDSASEIDGSLSVSRDFITASLDLTIHNNLSSTAIVNALGKDDLESKLSVARPDIPATITLNIHDDLNSSISVKQKEEAQLDSKISISRKEVPADIIVPFRNDINGTMVVRQESQEDVDTSISVSRPDIPGHLGIVIASSFPSTITVKRDEDEDFNASISIARDGYKDITAQIIPRPRDISEIPSVINVGGDNAYSVNDLTSKIHIRLKLPRHWNYDKDPELPRFWYKNANGWVNKNV